MNDELSCAMSLLCVRYGKDVLGPKHWLTFNNETDETSCLLCGELLSREGKFPVLQKMHDYNLKCDSHAVMHLKEHNLMVFL